jgi:hypothetical protein
LLNQLFEVVDPLFAARVTAQEGNSEPPYEPEHFFMKPNGAFGVKGVRHHATIV